VILIICIVNPCSAVYYNKHVGYLLATSVIYISWKLAKTAE
jgi:hypothetical protein